MVAMWAGGRMRMSSGRRDGAVLVPPRLGPHEPPAAAAQLVVRRARPPVLRVPPVRVPSQHGAQPRGAGHGADPRAEEIRALLRRLSVLRAGVIDPDIDVDDVDPVLVDMLHRALGRPWRVAGNGDIEVGGFGLGPVDAPRALERPRSVVPTRGVRWSTRAWCPAAIASAPPVRPWWRSWGHRGAPWPRWAQVTLAGSLGLAGVGLIVALGQPGVVTLAGARATGAAPVSAYAPPPELPTVQYVLPPADPGRVDPGLVDPGYVDPGYVDPGLVDPGLVDPGYVDPGLADPGIIETGVADPGAGDPGVVDPVPHGSGSEGIEDPPAVVQPSPATPPVTTPPVTTPPVTTPPVTTPPVTTPPASPSPPAAPPPPALVFPPQFALFFRPPLVPVQPPSPLDLPSSLDPVDIVDGVPQAPAGKDHLGLWSGSTADRSVIVIGAEHPAAPGFADPVVPSSPLSLYLIGDTDPSPQRLAFGTNEYVVGTPRLVRAGELTSFLEASTAPVVVLLPTDGDGGNVLVAEASPPV